MESGGRSIECRAIMRRPTGIILYGKGGHEGQGEFCKNITRLFSTVTEWTTIDLIGKASKWPTAEKVKKLARERITICDLLE